MGAEDTIRSTDSAKQAIVQICDINFTLVQTILGCTQLAMSESGTVFWLNLMFWIEMGQGLGCLDLLPP